MAYRNKTYVCFDGDNDIHYYRMMTAWKANDNIDFNFYDAHDLHQCKDSSCEATIKRSLRDRMSNSKILLVLVGEKTKNLYKFVRWEIEIALSMGIPIIVANLNNKRNYDSDRCPPILDNELAIHVSFEKGIIQFAIDTWPANSVKHFAAGKRGPFYYEEEVYKRFGL